MTPADDFLRRGRSAAQLLHGDQPASAVEAVRHLLAVQAQDLRSAALAIRARTSGLTARSVNEDISDKRSLVVTWLMRGTLHLVTREDYPWLLALTAPTQIRSNVRRLRQERLSEDDTERGLRVIGRALEQDGPLPRDLLAQHLSAAGIRTQGQAVVHLVMCAALRGLIVRGPVVAAHQAFALTRDWLGDTPAALTDTERNQALGRLALGFLRGHGPATLTDFATWSGLPVGDARSAFATISNRVTGSVGDRLDLRGRDVPTGPVPPRLLPMWDDYLLAWRDDRSLLVADEHRATIFPGSGQIGPAAVADGIAVGKWAVRRRRTTVTVDHQPFGGVEYTGRIRAGLEREARDVVRFETAEPSS